MMNHPEYPVGTVSTSCFSQPNNGNNSGYNFYYGGNGYVSDSAPRRADGMNPFANNGFYNQPVQPQMQPTQPDMGSGVMGMLMNPEPGIQPNSVYGCGNPNNNGFNTFATDARRADAMNQQNVGYNPWAQNQPVQPAAPVAPVNTQPQMNYGYNYGYGYGSPAANEYPVLSGAYQMPANNPFEKKNGVNQWDAMYGTNQFVFTGTGVMNSQWPVPNQPQNVMPNYTFPQNAMPNFSQPNSATFSGPELSWTAQANASWATK